MAFDVGFACERCGASNVCELRLAVGSIVALQAVSVLQTYR